MPDMIVSLQSLPSLDDALREAARSGLRVRRAYASEKPQVVDWAWEHFGSWAPEIEVCFGQLPIPCFLALRESDILGFAAYDAACRNFFGPTGVLPELRGQGIGRALLLAALHAQRAQGYAYSIIGAVGPADYYAKVVGARLIEDSTPGHQGDALPFKAPRSRTRGLG